MDAYDALTAPDPADWLDLDQEERIILIRDHHRKTRVPLDGARLEIHSTIHAIVENQLAMGDPPSVRRTLDRLRIEGLDRHDAIHAIGSVLMGHMHKLMTTKREDLAADVNEPYVRALEALTADSWRHSG